MFRSLMLLALGAIEDPASTVTLKTPDGAHEPHAAIDASGEVFIVYGTRDGVWCSRGISSGRAPVKVGEIGKLALGLRRGPRVAVAKNVVVVTAIAGAQGKGHDADVLSWRSTDRGETWSDPERVNDFVGSASEGLHAMASGPKGEIFCAWIDLRGGNPHVYGAGSTDGGKTWGPNRVVFGASDRICPCCHPTVAFDGLGKLFVMWRGVAGESRDMWIGDSTDLGATFSAPRKLGDGTWSIRACPMDGGSAVSAGGRMTTVWRRESKIYQAEVDAPEKLLGEGEQPWIACGTGGNYVVWLEKRGGKLMLLHPGASKPVELDRVANDPVIVAPGIGGGPVIAVWESGEMRSPRIVATRIDGPPPGTKW